LNITVKLGIGLALIIVIFLSGQSYQSFLTLEIQVATEYYEFMSIPAVTKLDEIRYKFEKMNGALYEYVVKNNEIEKIAYFESKETIKTLIKNYNELTFVKNSKGNYFANEIMRNQMQEIAGKYDGELAEYTVLSDQVISLVDSGKNLDRIVPLLEKIEPNYRNFLETLDMGKTMELQGKDSQQAKIQASSESLLSFIILINIFSTLLSVIIIVIISKSILKQKTQQKLLESEIIKKEKLSLVGELSSRLAHDIRNPLSVILTSLENLKLVYRTDEVQEKQFEKIHRAVFRITHQIDDVLDFVRKQPLKLNETKMSDVIADALDSVFIPNNITLKLPKNDVELNCDIRKLSIAFINLILNGIQSIDDKGVIEIRLKENTDNIVIEVEDSGKGIPKENLERIFEPLFSTKQTGTGLGLVSVKSIIKAHGGIISVTSPPTIFTITLTKQK